MAKKPKQTEEEKAVNYIIKGGIENLIESNPRFANYQDYLIKNVDAKGIWKDFKNRYDRNIKRGMKPQEARNDASYETEIYVASGNLLNAAGKKMILREGKLETSFFDKILRRPQSEGEKYLNRATKASNELLSLMKSGNYSIPKVQESLMTLQNLGFASPAVAILEENGIITEREGNTMMRDLYKNVDKGLKVVREGVKEYITPKKIEGYGAKRIEEYIPQKQVAAIIGFIGIFLLLFNLKITGAVIGGDSVVTGGIIGVFMIFFALLIFFRPLKRRFKK